MEGARRMRRMRSEVGWSQVLLCWPQWVVQMPELTCPLQSTPVQSYVHHSMPSPITYHKAIHHKTIYLIFDEERYIYFDVELSNSKTNIIIMILMMLLMMMMTMMMMISHVHRWVSETVSEWCECGVCEWEMWEWVSEWVMSEWVNEWVSECVSDCHACHAKAAEPQGTPGRTSDPLAVHIVPRLPRKRGGAPRDARAYIRPLGSAHCPTPATEKRRNHACHAKETEPQGTPGRTSDPLAVHIVPRLPRQSGGAPRDAMGVHRTPWQCTLSHACHAKEAEPQGTPGRTSDPWAVHIVPRLPRKRGGAPRDARAYIRPLGSAHCPTPATQKRRSPKGRQGVHPTPWQCTLSHACHAKAAEPQGTPGRASDPLAVHIVPRLPRKEAEPQQTPGRTSDPLAVHIVPRLPGRQGVHRTAWQCTLSHACHAKEAEPQGTPGRTSDPLAVHIVPRLPRKRGGAPRDARAYIRPLGSAHCPTPATQKRRSPKGRQGVHRTPWQCTLSHAWHTANVVNCIS